VDFEHGYRAMQSRDARFDGVFIVGVHSTGIYCRPSCPAVLPRRANVTLYPTAAAAQQAGLRACKRCRPDAAPGSPQWNLRADVAGRAMRLIADGELERSGVEGLAGRLGYSQRQLHRSMVAEVGAGPLAVARARRAQTARLLLETTDVPISQVALAAGFGSIRQFNDTIREVFALTPSELRKRGARAAGNRKRERNADAPAAPPSISLRLAYRAPLDLNSLLRFLGDRAVAGVEELSNGLYRRVLRLPHGLGVVSLSAEPQPSSEAATGTRYVSCRLRLEDLRDLAAAVQRCRRLLDLDADPLAVADVLRADELLAPLVDADPGRRVPGHPDPHELAIRAVLGQQVSVAAARTLAGRLTAELGESLPTPDGALTHAFPTAAALAGMDPQALAMPRSRATALIGLARALADGDVQLDPGTDRTDAEAALLALPGIGPWTASYVLMRALGDPDAFLPSDLGVRHALERLGRPGDPKSAATRAEQWRPWRSYALAHLWGSLGTPAPSVAETRERILVGAP
jgi:AraC family transcriptional regulator, regulatory protein of adaptative response / DNA-3-methyladenine glycosylase II